MARKAASPHSARDRGRKESSEAISQGRLIIVSNRLPVSLERKAKGYGYRPSAGGLATSLNALREQRELLWLGWPGIQGIPEEAQPEIEADLIEQLGLIPVFLPSPQFERFYNGFSNGTVWPLFHYFAQHSHYKPREWRAYRRINRIYRDRILQLLEPEDTLWIHDYHLMLLPGMIRAARPEANIGFFLHIPFPSYEIFRNLPWREAILRGLLGSDLVGFHSFSYARHFLSSTLRLLGLDQEFGRVTVGDREVRVDTFPLGLDVDRFSAAGENPEIQSELDRLKGETANRKVILSVDRLDFTKGILQRLTAYENFLERNRRWRGEVVLISVCVPSRTRVPEYRTLKRQVDELVGRINGRFGQPGWIPIWYLYRFLPFERLLALYLIADVALVTPLRDGMNLVAKEYLAARSDLSGALVLSETAGSAEELGEAILVNPFDQDALVHGLEQALRMPRAEQEARNRSMVARLRRYDAARWAEDFLAQLQLAGEQRSRAPRMLIKKSHRQLLRNYRQSERRLIMLDYDGTLVPFVHEPMQAEPDTELKTLLRALADDERNTLIVVSGRGANVLSAWLGDVGAHLVAEHGARIRRTGEEDWKSQAAGIPEDWMDELRPVLEIYVDRTPGASLEEKGRSLAWHYRRAEPALGSLRAKELTETLEPFVANTPLHILQGNKVIEVKPSTISKGLAIQPWLDEERGYDFVLAIGDDVTDEDLFKAVGERGWTIKVGGAGSSSAQHRLADHAAVRAMLRELVEGGQRPHG